MSLARRWVAIKNDYDAAEKANAARVKTLTAQLKSYRADLKAAEKAHEDGEQVMIRAGIERCETALARIAPKARPVFGLQGSLQRLDKAILAGAALVAAFRDAPTPPLEERAAFFKKWGKKIDTFDRTTKPTLRDLRSAISKFKKFARAHGSDHARKMARDFDGLEADMKESMAGVNETMNQIYANLQNAKNLGVRVKQ